MRYAYRNLVSRTGALNRAAFRFILDANVEAETNLALCVRARLGIPSCVPYPDVRGWYAAQARALDPALLSPEERTEIHLEQLMHLTRLAQTIRDVQIEVGVSAAEEMRP